MKIYLFIISLLFSLMFYDCKKEKDIDDDNDTITEDTISGDTIVKTLPKVKTIVVYDIEKNKAFSGGEIISDGGAVITAKGICWNTEGNPDLEDNFTNNGKGSDAFNCAITGLDSYRLYYVRAYATNSLGSAYGEEFCFVTLPDNIDTTKVSDVDGNVYDVIFINGQSWMKQNLKVTRYKNGDLIGTTDNPKKDISSQGYCDYEWVYDDNPQNDSVYGRLYTWYAVANSKGLCPPGWHIPSESEWATLSEYFGGDQLSAEKLKEEGTEHWHSPNYAEDVSEFGALPGGLRIYFGSFSELNSSGFWWTASQADSETAWGRSMSNNYTLLKKEMFNKRFGFSVRCIKD